MSEAVYGVVVGVLGVLAGLLGTYWTLRHNERMEARHREAQAEGVVRAALQAMSKARLHLVKAVLELAWCGRHDRLRHLDQCDERYEDLLLAVQDYCQLREGDGLRGAARRFRRDCLRPAEHHGLSGAGLAKAVRLAAEDFNAIYYQHARRAGYSPFPQPDPESVPQPGPVQREAVLAA